MTYQYKQRYTLIVFLGFTYYTVCFKNFHLGVKLLRGYTIPRICLKHRLGEFHETKVTGFSLSIGDWRILQLLPRILWPNIDDQS